MHCPALKNLTQISLRELVQFFRIVTYLNEEYSHPFDCLSTRFPTVTFGPLPHTVPQLNILVLSSFLLMDALFLSTSTILHITQYVLQALQKWHQYHHSTSTNFFSHSFRTSLNFLPLFLPSLISIFLSFSLLFSYSALFHP